jgi:hypothetical protein
MAIMKVSDLNGLGISLPTSIEYKPAGTPGGAITPRVVIFHVDATKGIPQPHDGLEWHFFIDFDGAITQVVDTHLRADANYHANPFAISVETAGLAAGLWTPQQLNSMAAIAIWAHKLHAVPLKRCEKWDGSGLGFHTMWGAPSQWTPVAKSCPGPDRKIQFDREFMPLINKLILTPKKDEPMQIPSHFHVAQDGPTPRPTFLVQGDYSYMNWVVGPDHQKGLVWLNALSPFLSSPDATPMPTTFLKYIPIMGPKPEGW